MTRGKRSNRGGVAHKTTALRESSRRATPAAVAPPDFSPLFSGPEVRLVNISRAGVKLECDWQLSTAANVCLRLVTTDTVFLLKGRVLRSKAAGGDESSGPFESVIAFDEDFMVISGNDPGGHVPIKEGPGHTLTSGTYGSSAVSNPPILAVTASSGCSGTEMREKLGFRR